MARLPQPGGDQGSWGGVLNDYLSVAHNTDGSLKADSVGSSQIQSSTITEAKLDSAVQSKLNTVGSGGAADGSITTAKLQDGAVTDVKVSASAAIAQSKIAGLTTSLAGKSDTSHTHTKADVGLANADNTSDANKPVSSATQTALNAKQDTLVSGTTIKTLNGQTLLGSGNITVSGGGGGSVDSVNGQTGDVVLTQDEVADGTTNRQFSATEKTKLSGIATAATANASDAQLRDRATHTGTQASTTVSDFTERVQDEVGAFLAAGSNITLNYNDGGNTLTISSTGGGGGAWGGITGTLSSQTDLQTELDTKVDGLNGTLALWKGTQSEYDLLTPNANTVYVIVED